MSYSSFQKYAHFILENYLNDFAHYQIKRGKELNIPLLRLFQNFSENDFFNYVLVSNRKFLEGIRDNRVIQEALESSGIWKKGEYSGIGKADILLSDIILIQKLRKESLINFLKNFSEDVRLYEEIILEMDQLFYHLTEISFKAFMEVQHELLSKEKHLTEKVLDSSLSSIVAMEAVKDENNNIKDFRYMMLNAEAEKMLGPKEGVIGSTLLEKFPSVVKEGIFEKYVMTVETGESFDMVFHYEHEGFNNWLRQVIVKWDDGLVITTEDITTQKESEEKIKNLNRTLEDKINERTRELQVKNKELKKINEDLDNFIYTASHDLKAPVSNLEGLIMALSEIINENGSRLSEKKELIGLMETSINRFKNTIRDLTDITKTQKQFDVELEEVDLEELLDDVLHLNQEGIEETHAQISKNITNCRYIKFSKSNLKSIFFNLINNAIKYRSPERNPEVSIICRKENNCTYIEVRDNGLGIPHHHLDKIFSMFKRFHSHVEGSGIGLYLVKRMVENSGGKIEVKSKENEGTVFLISLPDS